MTRAKYCLLATTVALILAAMWLSRGSLLKQDVQRTGYTAPVTTSSPQRTTHVTAADEGLPDPAPNDLPVSLEIKRGTKIIVGSASFWKETSSLPDGSWSPMPGKIEWYQKSPYPKPGVMATNRSIVAGHVAYDDHEDVFANLKDVRRGDEVVVTFSSERRYVFVVTTDPLVASKQYLTTSPRIWGGVAPARILVLMTCDDQDGYLPGGQHRKDNRVVVASLQRIE